MIDTVPMPLGALGAPVTRGFAASAPAQHELPIRFSGSGSEYFRIWIVNLLLTLLSLGLYLPWAKVRRLRYFYANTAVGEHTLDFHGDPKRMLRGFLLVGLLVLLYSVAGKISPVAGLLALVIVMAIWPALLRASQQFRLANTSWRGLRFRFDGDLSGAYRAVLPLFVPGALALLALFMGGDAAQHGAAAALAPLSALAALLMFPWLLWRLKKYQHDHLALGQVRTALRTGAGSFYLLALKTFGIGVLAMVAVGIAVAVVGGGSALALRSGGSHNAAAAMVAIVLATLLGYAAVILVLQPYLTVRLQNLVWNATGSRHVRFTSALRFWPLLRLTLKNWLLMLLSLGLYWPFARIALARMRLEAVTVHTLLPPDELVSSMRERADDAAGDAAGDLFGFDIGL